MISSYLYATSLVDPVVKVTSLEDASKFHITWPAQAAANGYRVYAGYDPLHIRSLVSGATAIASDTLGYTCDLPPLPPGQVVYFWVGSLEGATGATADSVRFIDELGSYHLRSAQYDHFNVSPYSDTTTELMCGDDQLYYIEEMRRRSKAILEDTGEEVDLFIKQWRGLPDPTTQDELGLDPNYQPLMRDDNTYGTGFYPGFFPAIRIRMRFGALPQSQLDYQPLGLRPLLDTESWTLWDPLMHENDILVRVATGQRYTIKNIAYSNYRGVPLTQRLTHSIINPTSPLQKITDAGVWSKWRSINTIDYMRIGWNVIPGSDSNSVDYLLFK